MSSTNPADALRGRMPDLYFVNASSAQMEHHSALLGRLPQEKRVIEFLRPEGSFLTELSLCAYDDTRPGLLAKICGTLAALKVKVHTASIFTLRDDETPIVLDTLQLSDTYLRNDRKLGEAKQAEIRGTLADVLAGNVTVVQLLSKNPRRLPWRAQWPLKILEIRAEPAPQQGQTTITIRTGKSQLAIFQMAAAMASLGLDIQTAQLHQGNKEAQGVFFVTGVLPHQIAATPEAGPADNALISRLRAALQTNTLPPSLSNP